MWTKVVGLGVVRLCVVARAKVPLLVTCGFCPVLRQMIFEGDTSKISRTERHQTCQEEVGKEKVGKVGKEVQRIWRDTPGETRAQS